MEELCANARRLQTCALKLQQKIKVICSFRQKTQAAETLVNEQIKGKDVTMKAFIEKYSAFADSK
eukprot:17539-Alexandrium_andersonii.AAC.1